MQPSEVDVIELGDDGGLATVRHVIARLQALKPSEEWSADDKLIVVSALAAYMKNRMLYGHEYGAPGEPNMQSIMEIIAMGTDGEPDKVLFEQRRAIKDFIDMKLVPDLLGGYVCDGACYADDYRSPAVNWSKVLDWLAIALGIYLGWRTWKAKRG